MTYHFGSIEDTYRANILTEFGAKGDGIADDTAAINNALTTGGAQIFFPPGTYKIDGYVVGSVANQQIIFDPGATLLVTPSTGGVTFSGSNQRIYNISVLVSATYTSPCFPLTISGTNTTVFGIRFEATADLDNTSLIRLAANDITIKDVLIISDFTFLRGISIIGTDDISYPNRVTVHGVDLLANPPVLTKQLGSLINIHGSAATVRDLTAITGGRTPFSEGVIRVRGSNTTLINPQIFAGAAQYGIFGEDSASEKLTIIQGDIQGRNNGTYVSNSEGVRVGHQSGHQKFYGTYINGWSNGVVFHGSADTPCFYGCIIANNDGYAFIVDAGNGIGAVRGLNISGCYLSDVQQDSFMHVISGKLDNCLVSGCEIGYISVAVMVDSGAQACTMTLDSNFIQGSGGGQLGIVQPNANSSFLFLNNTYQGVTTGIGYGAFASKAMDIFSPTLVDGYVTHSFTVGSNGNPWLRRYYTFFTANYAAGIPANDMVELDFSWADGAVGNYMLTFGIFGALAANTGLTFTAFVKVTGTVTLRARNHTGTPIGPISGTVHFEATKNF